MSQTIYIGADHRGFQLKETLVSWLESEGYQIMDLGNHHLDVHDDYPDFAFAVAKKVATEPGLRGIVVCGSGIGVTVAANKVKGIRATVGTSPEEIARGREDDDINMLGLSADFVSVDQAKKMIEAFLNTHYSGEARHVRRLAKISNYEQKQA